MKQTLSIGFSPCPNDTFMFDALVNKKIQSEDFEFEPHLHDVEQLNRMAQEGQLDVTKISFSNYPLVNNKYVILNSGSALGNGCGPLLISKNDYSTDMVNGLSIAIPGKYTTANLLMGIFFPKASHKSEMVFSDIEEDVLNGNQDAGLVIHENRFTYSKRGLKKIADMGELWEKATGSPVPLGCIVIKRSLLADTRRKVDQLVRKSIEMAIEHPELAMDYVRMHAQEMDESVMKQHIDLYVTNFSLDLGTEGKRSVELLFKKGHDCGLLPPILSSIFV